MSIKSNLKKLLKSTYELDFKLREVLPNTEDMDKKDFINVLTKIKEIRTKTDYIAEELGVDLLNYEIQFLEVVECLFRLAFNKKQIEVINVFLYELPQEEEDWDGKIVLSYSNKKEEVVDFRTPEQVWEVIKKLRVV